MIKLLVLDDEYITRKGIINNINWSDLGVVLIEEARDGLEGLDIASRLKPDIIISDIRMPRMNGIEFCKQIREQIPECRIIFLSGYSDIEYLKAAIHLNAISYIEKPINIEELQSVIKKAVDLCLESEKKKQTEKSIISMLSDSLPFIKQNIVYKLIGDKIIPEKIIKDMVLLGVPFQVNDIYTTSIIIPSYTEHETNESKQSCCNDIIQYLEANPNDFNHIATIKDFDHIIVISSHKPNIRSTEIDSVYKALKKYIDEKISICTSISWVVGSTSSELSEIRDSYKTAVYTLQKLFFIGYGNIFFFDNKPASSYSIDESNLTTFLELLRETQKDKITVFIDILYENIRISVGTPVNEVKNIFFHMAYSLFKEGEKRGLQLKESQHQDEKYLWALISKFRTLQELRDYLILKVNIVLNGIADIKSNSRSVLDVLTYIQENYNRVDLSVKILADHVYLTPTYLSSLFKKETGKAISEHIADVRIEKSIALLMEPQVKLYEIAKKTGYSDANYYSKAFKKQKGLTPSKFRRKYKS